MKRARIGLLIALVVFAGAVMGLRRFLPGSERLKYPYLASRVSQSAYEDLARKPGWKRSALHPAEGITLRGLARRPKSPDAPWILFYPGNDSTQLRTGQAFLERVAAGQDFGLAVYAYRGFDASDGAPRYAELLSDAPQIFSGFLKAEDVKPDRVSLVGFSIGGHFAVKAITVQRAASLTLLACVDDVAMVHPSLWQRFDAGERYNTMPLLPSVPAPVLVLQGASDDAFEGPGPGRAISKALGDKAQYVELEGVGHTEILENARALTAVHNFAQR
ncbi:MAG: hypothetical protein ACT4TC_04270 [Myxococcaceae bacterium]